MVTEYRVALRLGCMAALLVTAGCQSDPAHAPETPETALAERSFRVRYVTELVGVPTGKTLQLWIPVPHDDPHQTIGELHVEAPWPHEVHTDPTHGNRMLYFKVTTEAAEAEVSVAYDVVRREAQTDLEAFASEEAEDLSRWQRYLEPTRLVVVDDTLRELSLQVGAEHTTTLAKARAYYDRVRDDMSYDKSGQGWGFGDSAYACEVGKGNCTDFHSYFKSLCMAAGIPTRFQIGMWGRYDRSTTEYTAGGYHCWAEFYVPGRGWVPVDISEADKDPSKADYFFGAHSPNRCTLSTGRDLVLAPAQSGDPLNYFVNPYAELDGVPFLGVSKTAYWSDLAD